MLISSRKRRFNKRSEWYSDKYRVHLDRRLSKADAFRLVSDPAAVAQHDFLPLISFIKRERRYRRDPGEKKPVAFKKDRLLAYPSNRDGYIFSYYAERLSELYEAELARRCIDDVVIGYRKGSSNIGRAREAFSEIKARGDCVAVCLDIKNFFDNINHKVLKACWSSLVGGGQLPLDHYKVFCRITRYASMDRADLLTRLGFSSRAKDRDLCRPLCSMDHFRDLRGDKTAPSKLVLSHNKDRGIPQGTPLSAIAANISMMEFDTVAKLAADACGGSYRRYSDDILIICDPERIGVFEGEINRALEKFGETLHFNESKREAVHFCRSGGASVCLRAGEVKPLQYLGFTFDGRRALIRSGTIARFYRRMRSGVKTAKAGKKSAKLGKIEGRPNKLHKREVLARHSHLGRQSFVSSYAKRSAVVMGGLGGVCIPKQMSRHFHILKRHISE